MPEEIETIRQLQQRINDWSWRKGWRDKEVPVPESIALMHSELSEMLEEYREELPVDYVYYRHPKTNEEYFHRIPDGKPEGIGIELADLVIRALDFAARHGIDLYDLIDEKMKYNETRPYRHGDKVA